MRLPNVAIIDCGAGNLHSVRKAIASQLPEGATLNVVTEASALAHASHIVLPGVGAFADCMHGFGALPGMRATLEEAVLVQKKPFLGICVGMQMLFQRGYEHGTHAGLGWFEGEVRMLTPRDLSLRIPHMGWNQLRITNPESPITNGITDADYVYFVHSYAASGCKAAEVLATVDYGGEVVALIGRDNIMATQFHPEKSQATGLRMIQNFLNQ
jgi:imidazole glycerol-phosphate synthase subunit HisH